MKRQKANERVDMREKGNLCLKRRRRLSQTERVWVSFTVHRKGERRRARDDTHDVKQTRGRSSRPTCNHLDDLAGRERREWP